MSSVVGINFTEKDVCPHPITALMEKMSLRSQQVSPEAVSEVPASSCGAFPPHSKQRHDINLALLEHINVCKADRSTTSFYYIVNSEWWISWRRFVSEGGKMPGPITCQHDTNIPPGVPKNAKISFAGHVNEETPLGDFDYVALPPVAWKALSAWFGATVPLIYKGYFNQPSIDGRLGNELIESNLMIDRTTSYLPTDIAGTEVATGSAAAVSSAPTVDVCFTCGTPSSNRCARCTRVHYCSAVCQKSHW